MGKSFLSEFPSFAESLEEFTVHAFEQQGWLGSRDQKDGRYSSQSFLGCRLRAGYDEHAQHALALVRSVRSFHVRVFKNPIRVQSGRGERFVWPQQLGQVRCKHRLAPACRAFRAGLPSAMCSRPTDMLSDLYPRLAGSSRFNRGARS